LNAGRVVFGIRAVKELVCAQPGRVAVIYVSEGLHHSEEFEITVQAARDRRVRVETRPRAVVAELAENSAHQGIVAIAGEYRYATVGEILASAGDQSLLVLLIDGITDPHNFGAIVRSGEVLGAHGVIVSDRNTAPVTGAVVKAAAGATERVRIARVPNLIRTIDSLRGSGVRVWGTASDRGELLATANLREPTALVVGGEGVGMREAVARRCDGLLRIPQRGQVASLNASVAGAIVLYEAMRQRT
jgi:23S rRNA (guanosine2251-2'-O)-methyltransferase